MNSTDLHATRITFLLLDNMLATSSTLPMEMLLAAESAAKKQIKFVKNRPAELQLHTASPDGNAVVTRSGLRWMPDGSLKQMENSDIIYLPGLWRNPRPALRGNTYLLNWLRE